MRVKSGGGDLLEAEPTCKRQHLQAGVGLRSSEGSRDMQGVPPCWRWVRVPPPPHWRQQGRPRMQRPCCRHQRQCPLGWRPTATTETTMEAAPLQELQEALLLLEAARASASFLGPAPAAVEEAPFSLEAAGATTRCSVPARGARCSAPAGSSRGTAVSGGSAPGTGSSRGDYGSPAGWGRSPAGWGRSPAGWGRSPAGWGRSPAGWGRSPAGWSLLTSVLRGLQCGRVGSGGVFGSVDRVIGGSIGGVLGFEGVSESGGVPGGSRGCCIGGASTEEVSVLEAAPASAALAAAPPFDVSGAPPPALKVASLEASLEAASTDSASALEVAAAAVEAAATRATV
ncbi:uncharacterized protein LOC123777499 [Ursus americanus]|uniref:uncharacterized protein LOC123777499 n=1 Tax=Ursus americanus TaxID=9643 RepID=UPI001E679C14|nr:uncharacterized protein LOC123777499 [Ursus americanus]XP_045630166.1 uncharacterized protein LOC123777499 [Ursus americanus]XP_045630175.1 uncharacterized protein LOC123777499 [Ursus americanus]